MSKPLIIGIGHRARQGKDSAARFIHETFPQQTRIYSFASSVRAVCRTVLGMEEKDAPLLQLVGTEVFRLFGAERDQAISDFIEARKAQWAAEGRLDEDGWKLDRLQQLSDIVGGDENVWVNAINQLIAEDNPQIALLSDMRFPNEAAICDSTMKVTCWIPTATSRAPVGTKTYANSGFLKYVTPDRPADHPSETALDDYEDWTAEIEALRGDMKELRRSALRTFNALAIELTGGPL